jgi:O6-methylguanine-DNA--protein-cysteine methyltransferase
MLEAAGALDPAGEACREYERVVHAKYPDQIRTEAKEFSTKRLACQSGVERSAIMNFKEKRHNQAAYFAKAHKGHTLSAEQENHSEKRVWQVRNRVGIGLA